MNLRLLLVPAFIAGLHAASAADITGTVTLNGTPPPDQINNDIKENADCGKLHADPVKVQFYVVGANNGLKDTVVMLTGISGKSTGASAAPVVMDQKGCLYTPTILALQTGQKMTVKNSDPVMHNVHPTPMTPGNAESNKAQMAGAPDLEFTFPKAENFLKIKCDVHPWMFAWVTVIDHPYFAVTDKDGNFKISNVPPGKYTVEAIHRKAGKSDKEIEVKADGAKVDFTLEGPKK